MSRKTTSKSRVTSGPRKSSSAGSKKKTIAKGAKGGSATKIKAPSAKKQGAAGKSSKSKQSATRSAKSSSRPKAAAAARRPKSRASAEGGTAASSKSRVQSSPHADAGILSGSDRDPGQVIESLTDQVSVLMSTLKELGGEPGEQGQAVVRTAPLDRATASFHRLMTDVIAEQYVDVLPTLVNLRNEMASRARDDEERQSADDFHRRGTEMLDHALTVAQVERYEAREGDAFDPLIHAAVGETCRDELEEGTVGEAVSPGFRTNRGQLISPARVRINRR